MAKFSYNPPKDFLDQLGRLTKIEKIAPKMINESLPIVESKLIKELAWYADTGELQSSIQISRARKMKGGGYFGVAMPTGESYTNTDVNGKLRTRGKPVRNMEKLAYLEFGTSKQAAKPLIVRVLNDSEDSVQMKMQSVFNREAKK